MVNGRTGVHFPVRSSSHDAFDLLNWAEKGETEIIDVDAQAPDNIRDASDLDSALFNQIAIFMRGESMQIMHKRRLAKRYSNNSRTGIAADDVRSEPAEDHEG